MATMTFLSERQQVTAPVRFWACYIDLDGLPALEKGGPDDMSLYEREMKRIYAAHSRLSFVNHPKPQVPSFGIASTPNPGGSLLAIQVEERTCSDTKR